MIIHSTAGMAIVTAVYFMGQTLFQTTPENPAQHQKSNAPIVVAQAETTGKSEILAQAQKDSRKKIIVIGKNSVSVKYVQSN